MYFLDRWTVTEKHIIDMEQKSLFSRSISKQEIDRIQDVTAEIKGFFPTLFNYGDVFIQSAGEQERFIFSKVADPYRVVDVIMKMVDAAKQKTPA